MNKLIPSNLLDSDSNNFINETIKDDTNDLLNNNNIDEENNSDNDDSDNDDLDELDNLDDIDDLDNIENSDDSDIDTINSNSDNELEYDFNNLKSQTNVINNNFNSVQVDNKDRISKPILTKFEYPKIFSIRKHMLTHKFIPFIKTNETDINTIIKEEIIQKKIPVKIKRPLPNNRYEIWKLSELEIPSSLLHVN